MIAETYSRTSTQKKYPFLSKDSFHTQILRERALTDRNNNGFSLVLFPISQFDDWRESLLSFLPKRLRYSDSVGFFDDRHIGVLLPETSRNGANKIVRDLTKHLFPQNGRVLTHRIYTYPSEQWSGYHSAVTHFRDVSAETIGGIAVHKTLPRWKRTIDVTFSLISLIILAPLFLTVALLIKLVSPGPVFFVQKRVGHTGRLFNFLKFRTMHHNTNEEIHRQYLKELINAEATPMQKIANDLRIIPFGKFLRKASIDELPQLINVLRGEMTLVGPRPCIPYEAEDYLRWHARRFDIVPGITGLWQVNGKNNTTFKEMIRMDIQYASNISLWLDLWIMLKTPFVIFGLLLERNEAPKKNKESLTKHREPNMVAEPV